MKTQILIHEISTRLVQAYHPLEIYLYGPKNWSGIDDGDIELVVVVDQSKEPHRIKRSFAGDKALFDLRVGTFVFVYTKQEFEAFLDDQSTLAYLAKNQGQKIYAKA